MQRAQPIASTQHKVLQVYEMGVEVHVHPRHLRRETRREIEPTLIERVAEERV